MTVPIDERLGVDIKRAEQALIAAKNRALAAHGLGVAQYAAMLTLRDSPGISGAGLARACVVTPQAAAAVLKTLEHKGLVERARDDWNRNSTQAMLTPEGRRLLAAADRDASAVEQRMLDALDPGERESLRDLLHRCAAAIDDAGETPATSSPARPRPDNATD